MAGASPTQNTLKRLRKEGWLAAITEHWNPHVKIRQDLYGWMDVIAVRGPRPLSKDVEGIMLPGQIMGVQTTSVSNVSGRKRKILHECEDRPLIWLRAGGLIEIHGWQKIGHRWHVKTVRITALDFEAREVEA